MPQVGDRVQVRSSKGGPREGLVIAADGGRITLQWPSGEETTMYPGPGVVRVVGRGRVPAKKAAPAKKGPAKKATAKKGPAKKATAKKAVRKVAAPKPAAKRAAAKKAAVKKATPTKKAPA